MADIKKAGDEVLYRAIHRMLEIETPNLQEYNLDRAIAFGAPRPPPHSCAPLQSLRAPTRAHARMPVVAAAGVGA